MHPEQIVNDWLASITLGDGQAPALDSSGVTYVTIDDAFSIGIGVNAEKRQVGFVCFLVRAPEPSDGPQAYQMLTMNLALLATHNAALGIDAASGMVVLARTAFIDALTKESFETLFLETGGLARTLRTSVQDMGKAAVQAGTKPGLPDDLGESWLRI